ncbi:MAG: DUF937 domain-containing protein [Gammaproteobacteria bacterium]|nr:DUF937 domain-containing protein [Gammaproteobacteria bacterium]MDH3768192.1 DUF937 domain-containing protein [Gammaproteobacteria bacterium]
MDLLKMLLEGQGGGLLKQVADKCQLDESQAGSAVSALFPSLADGMKGNISKPGGLEDLLGAIQSGNHTRYVDNPAEIASPTGIDEGNSILGHILGNKDRSRQVATQAAQKTGIDVGILKSMLPMIAAAMMGGISGKAQSSGLGRQPDIPGRAGGALDQITGGGGFGAILGKMLDINAPSQPAPEPEPEPKRGGGLLDIVGKFFK